MMQFCERHLWSMLVATVLACATTLFAGHRAALHSKEVAIQLTHQQPQDTAVAAR